MGYKKWGHPKMGYPKCRSGDIPKWGGVPLSGYPSGVPHIVGTSKCTSKWGIPKWGTPKCRSAGRGISKWGTPKWGYLEVGYIKARYPKVQK